MAIRVDPNDTFHVLIGSTVSEMTLDALDDAYHGELITEATLLWQEGLGEWLRLDVVLEKLAAQELEEQRAFYSAPPALPDDVYFVLLGPDDVKQMSLEQLDDAYRLDLVDETTLVWQPHFTEWIPLETLLGEQQEAPVPVLYNAPSDAPRSTPRPMNVDWSDASPSRLATQMPRVHSSFAPVAFEPIPEPEPASPWFRRGLVAAAACMLFVAGHRHGLTHAVASAVGQEETFASLVGAPSVNTPAGLSSWLARLTEDHGLDHLAATDPIPEPKKAAAAAPEKVEPAAGSLAPARENPTPAKEPSPALAAPLPAAAPAVAEGLPGASAGKFNDSLSGKKPARPAAKPARAKQGSSHKPLRGSSDAYDPMNGTL